MKENETVGGGHLVDWELVGIPGSNALLVQVDNSNTHVLASLEGNHRARGATNVALKILVN